MRVHREGEGAPYTGLKPAGEIPPGIALADKALESGSSEALQKTLVDHLAAGLQARFARAVEAKKHAGESVEKGREYVELDLVVLAGERRPIAHVFHTAIYQLPVASA